MIHSPKRTLSNLILAIAMIATIWTVLGYTPTRADSPIIIDSLLEESNLSVSYICHLDKESDKESDKQQTNVGTFEFGRREAFKPMNMSDTIDAQHRGDGWIKLYK